MSMLIVFEYHRMSPQVMALHMGITPLTFAAAAFDEFAGVWCGQPLLTGTTFITAVLYGWTSPRKLTTKGQD